MKIPTLPNFAGFAILAAILCFPSPALASSDPLIMQANDQLHAALNSDPGTSADDKTAQLKSALELLQKAPAIYRGQRKRAIEDVKAALFELSKGDPDNKVNDYIRKALDELHNIS